MAVDGQLQDGSVGTYFIVTTRDRSLLVDGGSDGIRELNRKSSLLLERPDQAASYLRFFCDYVAGGEGPFTIVDSGADLPWLSSASRDVIAATQEKLVPFSIARTEQGWKAKANVLYGSVLFTSEFVIKDDGTIEIVSGDPLTGQLPVAKIYFHDGLRITDARLQSSKSSP